MDKATGMVEMEGKRFLVEVTVEDGMVVIRRPSGTPLRNPTHMVYFKDKETGPEVKVYVSDGGIEVLYREGHLSGVAELSDMGDGTLYFNRLYIHQKLRGRGISHKLLTEVVKAADKMDKEIVCEINPYGPLNHEQLVNLYRKYGFENSASPEYVDAECGVPMHRKPTNGRT